MRDMSSATSSPLHSRVLATNEMRSLKTAATCWLGRADRKHQCL
jgi:hypothetical protein